MPAELSKKLSSIENQNITTTIMIIRLIITVLVLYFVNRYYLQSDSSSPQQSHVAIILAFIFTIFILDSLDCQIALAITGYGLCDSEFYEKLDKINDMIALGIFVFVIVPKIDPNHAELAENLWYFRLVGVVGFFLTGSRSFLFIFGNYVEIAVFLSVFEWYNHPILVGVLFLVKFFQEVILHSGFVDKRNIMKQIGFRNLRTL
ncbi:MAG: hypothetical protein M1480_06580 [Bacteroidetes bacterium]|nr:hypothetical protein [Bacteroidota bacterium]